MIVRGGGQRSHAVPDRVRTAAVLLAVPVSALALAETIRNPDDAVDHLIVVALVAGITAVAWALIRTGAALEARAADLRTATASLEESEARYRSLFDDAPIGLFRSAPDGRFRDVNAALVEILGYPDRTTLLATDVVGGDAGLVSLRTGSGGDVRVRRYDGTAIWVRCTVKAVRRRDGGVLAYEGAVEDVTGRRMAEEFALNSEHERYRAQEELRVRARQQEAIAELGIHALATSNVQAIIERAVRLVTSTLGVQIAEVLERTRDRAELAFRAAAGIDPGPLRIPAGRHVLHGYTIERDGAVVVRDLADETRAVGPRHLMDAGAVSGVTVVVPGRGGAFGVLGAFATTKREFSADDVHFLQAVANVIAEVVDRDLAEERVRRTMVTLRESDWQRRRVFASLVRAQEEERKRISDDIHDDSIQVVTAAGLRLQLLRDRVRDPDAVRTLDELQDTLDLAVMRLRALLVDLRPPPLDGEGLRAALAMLLERARAEASLESTLRCDLPSEPGPAIRTVVYRLVQEAVANVRKHARARSVDVSVTSRDGGVHAKVTDDGDGFDPEVLCEPRPGHLGVEASRERAEMAGGWWQITTEAGRGTSVEFWVPCPRDEADAA